MHKIMKSVLVCSFHRYSILKRDKTFSEGSVMCICKAAGVNLCMVVKSSWPTDNVSERLSFLYKVIVYW